MPASQTLNYVGRSIDTDPIRNFKFLVLIPHTVQDPLTRKTQAINWTLGFTSVGGLSASNTPIPYRQGGYNTTAMQVPGQTSFTPITLTRGVLLGTKQNWNWFNELFAAESGRGTYVDNGGRGFRTDVQIFSLPHPTPNKNPDPAVQVAKWTAYNAWPQAIQYSDLNAGDNAFVVEQMVLVHEGFNFNLADFPYNHSLL